MSIALINVVWRMDLPCTDKMVLMALADGANDDGLTWLPMSGRNGRLGLRQKTSLSERCIQQAIGRLVDAGHLSRDERPGKGVIYTVHPQDTLPLDHTPARNAGRSKCGAHVVRETPARRAPKPSYNHHIPQGANAPSPPKGAARRERGERIDPEWSPPPIEELPPAARALAEQWPDGAYEAEAEAFLNYWQGEGRQRARKIDWPKTWCDRIVQVAERVKRAEKAGVRFAKGKAAAGPLSDAELIERYTAAARQSRRIGREDEAADYERLVEQISARAAAPAETGDGK